MFPWLQEKSQRRSRRSKKSTAKLLASHTPLPPIVHQEKKPSTTKLLASKVKLKPRFDTELGLKQEAKPKRRSKKSMNKIASYATYDDYRGKNSSPIMREEEMENRVLRNKAILDERLKNAHVNSVETSKEAETIS